MSSRSWRLLVDGPAPGPWNMGLDEALMESAASGQPVLRFYGWDGPWLSLGYAQRASAERRAACASAGVGIVRRATGGGAVLHGADLTYAVIAPENRLPRGLGPTYAAIAGGLVAGLRALGIDAERTPPRARGAPGGDSSGASRPFDCFAEAAGDEICAGGRKLVGSAQRRAAGIVLQHGSIRLEPDSPRVREVAGIGVAGATSLAELSLELEIGTVRDALVEALGCALGGRFEVSAPTSAERDRAGARSGEPPSR